METNTPPHYGGKDNPYEPLKIIQHYGLGFEIGNVIKYCLRAGKKEGESEAKDLRKAIDYLTRRVEWLEANKKPKPLVQVSDFLVKGAKEFVPDPRAEAKKEVVEYSVKDSANPFDNIPLGATLRSDAEKDLHLLP